MLYPLYLAGMNIMQADGSVHTSGCQDLIWLGETLSFFLYLAPSQARQAGVRKYPTQWGWRRGMGPNHPEANKRV